MGPKKTTSDCGDSSQVLHKVATRPGGGVRLSSQTRQVVKNMRRFFEKEKECRSTINRQAVVKRTAEATGISEGTVRDILNEYLACDSHLLTPAQRYSVSRICINPESFDREEIRRLVHSSYSRKEHPTILGVLQKQKSTVDFQGANLPRLLQPSSCLRE